MRFFHFAAIAVAACAIGAAPGPKPAGSPAPAKVAPAKPAQAKGDPYSVTVPVDATAASASVAENNAINGGRAKAWTVLAHRLVPQKDWGKLPPLESAALERLIRGYSVANERRSTTRYVAHITYVFNPAAVKHLFRVANLGVAEQGGTAILLVAMSPTYNAHSAWAQAVARPKYSSAQFPLVTPIGDAVDQSSLGPLRFADASWGQVQSAAARVHAGDAVLMQAGNPAASKLTVRMRRIGPGKPVVLADVEVPVPAGAPPEKTYAAAAEQAEAAIEDAWKNKGTVDLGKKTRMVVEARISSLDQWNGLFSRLSSMPSIGDVDLIAMNTGEARVGFSYTGTPEQLRAAAEQSNLTLTDRGGSWWLSAGQSAASEAASPE